MTLESRGSGIVLVIYIRMSRNTSKERRRKEGIKGEKIIINFKRELLYPRFGTLKQQKIKIKANKKKKQTQIGSHKALHLYMES